MPLLPSDSWESRFKTTNPLILKELPALTNALQLERQQWRRRFNSSFQLRPRDQSNLTNNLFLPVFDSQSRGVHSWPSGLNLQLTRDQCGLL